MPHLKVAFQILLFLTFAIGGTYRLLQPIEALASKMLWVSYFDPRIVRSIAFVEVLCGVGLVLPFMFKDLAFDFIFYAMIPFSFALYDPANAQAACFLVVSFFSTAVSLLAFSTMAEKRGLSSQDRGVKSLYFLGGLTEGAETTVLLLAMTVSSEWFVYYAYGFGVLCWITAATRVLEARRLLR